MVGHAGSSTGIVHADMILTPCRVKVKVTELLNFQKLPKTALSFISAVPVAISL